MGYYRLVRIDCETPSEIILSMGLHQFGRDVLFDCTNLQVSRQHGLFIARKDSLTLTALSEKPCFIKRNGMESVDIMTGQTSAYLYNGDKIGLLADEYWYKVVVCGVRPDSQPTRESSPGAAADNEPSDSKEGIVNQANPDQLTNPPKRAHLPDEGFDLKKVKIEPADDIEPADGAQNADYIEPADDAPNGVNIEPADDADNPVKIEPADDAENPVKIEPNRYDQQMPSYSGQRSPPLPRRERCYYGHNCYRKKEEHKVQYSHPADSDWGTGSHGSCPYGAECVKRDLRHWRDHAHPPDTPNPIRVVRRLYFVYTQRLDDGSSAESSEGSADCDFDLS